MSYKPYWFQHISTIERWLEAIAEPVLDTRTVMGIFQIRRRQAQRLMHQMGAVATRHSFVIPRTQVIAWVQVQKRGGEVAAEVQRVERIERVLDDTRPALEARRIRLNVQRERGVTLAGLPSTIQLHPGRLEVAFGSFEDLATQLFTLAQAMAEDLDAVRAQVEELPRERLEV